MQLCLGLPNFNAICYDPIALAKFPPRPSLIELDFSLGTLSDVGVNALLNSPVLDSLVTLNLSQCYLSKDIFPRLSELNCSVAGNPLNYSHKEINTYIWRRCSVAE
ncbi:MAG: hypothetical protein AAGD25_36890 [Cyanobacteria bacterium P01_F01_bin.150]